MLKTEEYNQPVLVPPGHMDDRNRSDVHMKSSKTEDMHNSSVQAISHPIPVGCSLGSTLEPIQQGQELSVGSLTSSPVHINSPLPVSSNHNNPIEQGSKFTVQTYNSPNHNTATAQFKVETCCPCRMLNTDGQSLQHQQQQQQQQRYNNSHETTHTSSKIPITNTTTGTRVKIAEFHSHSLNIHGQSDSNNNNNTNHITINKDSITSKSNWARGLFERLRAASLTTSTIDTKLLHSPYATVGHNDSTQRYKEYYPHHQNAVHLTPDFIDPKRLPKAHGPLSNCLEFSKKPLQKSNNNNHLQLHSNTKPIPVSSTHIDFTNTMNLSTSSSSSSNTRRRRIRWFSHSTSCDPGPGDPLLSSSNHHAHLSSSAAEEIQGAVNILAGRQVFPSAGSSCTRPGIRVKSASESQHLLVISKSLSNSKEDFSPCAFGQFDENRVYTTLFRHSTCYDVLPDSGKLVIVDSRLPTLRAISALLDNGVIAAPVWCSETQSYLGVFSQELALDMLGHLHYSEVNTSDGIVDGQWSSSATPSSPTSPTLSSFNASLFRWGSKQLGDVLNLMYGLSDGRQLTDLFVHPQYCLQKALYRLFHHPEQHNANKANQYNNRQHQTLLKFKLSNASGHRASYPNNSPKAFLEETVGGGGGGRFARQSSTFFPSNSNHSSSAVSISEGGNDSASSPPPPPLVKLNSPLHQQSAAAATAGTTPPIGSYSSSTNSTDRNKAEDPSSSNDNIQRVSSKCCAHSNPSSLYTSLLSYLLVIDNHSGNALGLLGSDRLLAYLRLRVDELPSTGRMIMPIGSVHGLRWAERYPGKSEVYSSYLSPSPNKASTILNSDHLTQLKEVPVLHLTDRVSDALQVFMCWLPQLPCLPVIHFVDNDQLRPIDFIGLISPGDLLNFIMCSTPDTALDEPISKIMEKKSLHCAAQQNCVCFVTETLAIVLDRMFRLKAPCLIMFDTRKSSASCAIATKPFGQPVGMVTAKDILHSVILGHRHRHHHHHHQRESGQQHSSQPENINQIASGVDVSIPHDVNHGSSSSNHNIYKSSGSFESGIHSSSCQDGREFIRGDLSSNNHNNNGNTERVHFVDIDENKKRSPSPLSVCSLSSTGTFSASSPESDVEQSLSNEHFKSACNNNNNINNNVRSSVDCNCSCHRYDNGSSNNKDPIIHQQQQQPMTSLSSSSGGRQSHPLKDPRDSTIASGSTGLVDKIASRFLPHNLIHNSGWSSDRRSSEPYTTTTKKDKMKRKMHILDNQRRPSPQIAKQSTTTAQYHHHQQQHQQQQHHVHYAESSHCVYPVSSLVAIDEMMTVGSGGVTSTSATTTCTTNTTNSTVSSNISSTQVNTTVSNATDHHHMLPPSNIREEDDAVFPMD